MTADLDTPKSRSGCRLPSLIGLIILALICLGVVQSCGKAASFIGKLNELLGTAQGLVAGAAGRTDITDSFRQSLIEVKGTNGDVLETGTIEVKETFTRQNALTVAWNLVYLGTTTSEIEVPAVYRYHILLSDPWQVSIQGDRCTVVAPKLRPTLPPAIRTNLMQKRTAAGWGRFNAEENLSDLEKSITPSLETRAGNPGNIDLVREPSRKAIAAFVKTWLLKNQPGQATPDIQVYFPDERIPDGPA
jgi:hypothetical protein